MPTNKLITLIFSIMMLVIFSYNLGYAGCVATFEGNATDFLTNCADTATNIGVSNSVTGIDSVHTMIADIAKQVIAFGALFAIGAIVFSGIQYTTSYGDDEKVKKAKMTGIYAVTGLLLLLIAFPMVNIVVDFIYKIGEK